MCLPRVTHIQLKLCLELQKTPPGDSYPSAKLAVEWTFLIKFRPLFSPLLHNLLILARFYRTFKVQPFAEPQEAENLHASTTRFKMCGRT